GTGEQPPYLFCLGAQHGKVGTVHPDDDVPAGARGRFLDLLFRVVGHVAGESRVPIHDLADPIDRAVVVGGGVDGQPQLAGVDPVRLVGRDGPADVGADIVYTRDRPQLGARLAG